MAIGIVGKKCGMTRIFTEEGASIPVSVVEVTPNRVTQIKDMSTDGYCALQVTAGYQKTSRLTRPLVGHFAKAGVEAGRIIKEFRLSVEQITQYKMGDHVGLEIMNVGQEIDVTGITKGKGFAGCVKRHHFRTQDATHGNSLSHRAPGSIGQRQTPGRVMKGKRMAGHLGHVQRTIHKLEVVRLDAERNLVFVKGGIPGAPGEFVIIKPIAAQKKGA